MEIPRIGTHGLDDSIVPKQAGQSIEITRRNSFRVSELATKCAENRVSAQRRVLRWPRGRPGSARVLRRGGTDSMDEWVQQTSISFARIGNSVSVMTACCASCFA